MMNTGHRKLIILNGLGLCPEVKAWVQTLTGMPSPNYLRALNTLVLTLIANGTWTELDRFWIFAQEQQSFARVSIANPFSTQLTEVNSPSWNSNGYTGNGTSSYLNLQVAPNGLSKYLQNTATHGVYSRTSLAAGTSSPLGAFSATSGAGFFPRFTGNLFYGYLNNLTSSVGQSNSSTLGLLSAKRTGSTNFNTFLNTTSLGTETQASTAPVSNNFYCLCRNNNGTAASFSTAQIAMAYLGGNITISNLYTPFQLFATTIGFQV